MELSKSDYKYFNLAKHQATLSDYIKCHTGCVITYKNKILSQGFNCNKTHPLQKKFNKYRFSEDGVHKLHAESNALISIIDIEDIDWKKVKVYTYRIMYVDGKEVMGLAKPCKSCLELIKTLDIHNIYYTTNEGYAHEYLDY